MTQIDTATSSEVEQVNPRLEELRRSFGEDICCAPPEDTKNTEEFLLLTLSGEVYAYPVAHALEVVQVPSIAPVPNVPPAVLGIVNFRGQILSVTTIHGLLGLTAGEPGTGSRIIVTKDLSLVSGILVDSVERIAEIAAEDIQPLPVTIGDEKARLLAGQVYVDNRVVFILDMEQLCGSESLGMTWTDPPN